MKKKRKKISIKGRIVSFRARVYKWLMQLAVRRGYREAITYGFGYSKLLEAWKAGDVVVGDLIYISKRIQILAGMNRNGGPGQTIYAGMGMPTPVFIPANPWERRVWTSFDTLHFPPWSKIGHLTKEEWDKARDDVFDRMMPVAL